MNNSVVHFLQNFSEVINIGVTIGIFSIGYILQRRADRIQKLLTWNQYREPIKLFADEVVTVISQAEALCEVNPESRPDYFWERYNNCLAILSSLRDRGKFIIPNHVPGAPVKNRHAAYNGRRHDAMECICVAYKVVVALDYKQRSFNHKRTFFSDTHSVESERIQVEKLQNALKGLPKGFEVNGFKGKGWSCKAGLVEAKRQFVTIVQDMLAPKTWSEKIQNVVR